MIDRLARGEKCVIWVSGISPHAQWALEMKSRYSDKTSLVFTAHGLVTVEARMGYSYDERAFALEKSLLTGADACVFVSNRLSRLAGKEYELAHSRVHVIPNGVEEKFLTSISPGTVATEIGGKNYILAVTGVRRVKGLDFLLESVRSLGDVDAICVIVGHVLDEAYDTELRSKYSDLFGSGRVRIMSEVTESELLALYDGCVLSVLPSEYEPFGMVALESMARGKATIVSDRAGILDFLHPGEDVVTVAYGDSSQLGAVLRRLLLNESVRAEIGAHGKEAAARMVWKETAKQYRALFENLAVRQP